MLVLTRRPGQAMTITTPAGVITVEIVRVRGDLVRLGITAPLEYTILRDDAGRSEPPAGRLKQGNPGSER